MNHNFNNFFFSLACSIFFKLFEINATPTVIIALEIASFIIDTPNPLKKPLGPSFLYIYLMQSV